LAKLLNKDDKIKDISVILDSIPSVSVGVVNLAYPAFVKLPVSGFGYLIPQSENENESILGTIFDSDAMPHQSQMPVTRLTVMMGGYRFDSLFGNPSTVSKDRLLKVATEAVKKHLGITFDPLDSLVNVHQKCIPQYLVGHRQKMSVLHHLLCTSKVFKKRLSVVGASYTGVSVNDCVFESYKSVQRFSKGMENGITGLEKFI
jgi:oxygen-dependent protoporphyrinogen oxidase